MATTPILGLPYPDGTDPPCDGAEQIAALADRYGQLVADLDTDLGRVRTPLAAVVSYAGPPLEVFGFDPVISGFNVVDHDVGGWARLGVTPDRLVFPRTGLYVIGAELLLRSQPGLPSVYVGLDPPLGLLTAFPDLDNGDGSAFFARAATLVHGVAGGFFRATANTLSGGSVMVLSASLFGFWMADP